ncbi:MAG: DsbA family oxidoreductase [Prevotella sp.]|nr:DsbA family oxidoreductase [Prevotella sp.]
MKIEIWSDIACPYCYIGKRKLETALDKFPYKDEVEMVWHSYELDAELPKEALKISIYEYFAAKYRMSLDESHQNMENVTRLAKEVGLNYDFDKLVVANTSDALRLVKLANEQGLATEAEEELFDAYFVKGKDISDKDTLIELGSQIGLDRQAIVNLLVSDKYQNEIKSDVAYSENVLNLEYIPFYIFNDKHMVEGSISVEDYLKILNTSYNEWKNGIQNVESDLISGRSCSIDGVCD